MKIGILTLPLHTNYGGILQAYALQTVLRRMGHEVVTIDHPKHMDIDCFLLLEYLKRIIYRYIFGRNIDIFAERVYNQNQVIIESKIRPFINQYIKTKIIKSFKQISSKDYDAIIVGSDQVWRPMYFSGLFKCSIDNAFLSFANGWNIKRISYAASFGTDDWEYSEDQTQVIKKLISSFDAVSVREQNGIKLCEKYCGCENVKWVLDPTMLLSKEDYERLIPQGMKAPGDLMCYVLDEKQEISDFIQKIEKSYHLTAFCANIVNNPHVPIEQRIQPPVEQWIAGFRDTKLVVTDSFHACVFSILFHKPFIVVGNKERGYSRFESLLKLFNLENRLIDSVKQFDDSMLNPLSNDVYSKLKEYRTISMNFLINALKDE